MRVVTGTEIIKAGQKMLANRQLVIDKYGEGDWTCTVSKLTGTRNDAIKRLDASISEPPLKQFEIEVCTVTRREHGAIIEQKVFYGLMGMRKQFGSL